MSEIITVDAVASTDDADAPLRRIALFGHTSLYHDALKWLIEHRVSRSAVTHIAQEEVLFQSDAHLVISDVDLERITDAGLTELAGILQKLAPRPVLLITAGVDPAVLQQLLRVGAAGVVMKNSTCDVLVEAIESVSSGKVWLQREMLAETFGESSHIRNACSEAYRIAQLTQREREIVAVASCGLSNRQIASKLNISEATVRHHLSSVFVKLGVTNRGELIIFAYRHGLADETDRLRLC